MSCNPIAALCTSRWNQACRQWCGSVQYGWAECEYFGSVYDPPGNPSDLRSRYPGVLTADAIERSVFNSALESKANVTFHDETLQAIYDGVKGPPEPRAHPPERRGATPLVAGENVC